jgi:hypothetical protein
MDSKPVSKSKSIWFNVVGGLFTAMEAFTGLIQAHVSANVYLIMLTISVAGNFALRFYTDKRVTLKPES